jgi:hypothetical protein
MPKYDVTIQRTEYREHVFRVEADNQTQAELAALEASCDYNFNDSPVDHANEEVTGVLEADD